MPAPKGNKSALGNKGGQPTKYKPEYVEMAGKLSSLGWTDIEMADFFGICEKTLYTWQATHIEFLQAIKMGKDTPDDRTERSLYHRANGFEWFEEQAIKVKEVKYSKLGKKESEIERVELVKVRKRVPPDPTSAIFWLKNRRKDQWRDKQEHEHSGPNGGPIPYHKIERLVVDPKPIPEDEPSD